MTLFLKSPLTLSKVAMMQHARTICVCDQFRPNILVFEACEDLKYYSKKTFADNFKNINLRRHFSAAVERGTIFHEWTMSGRRRRESVAQNVDVSIQLHAFQFAQMQGRHSTLGRWFDSIWKCEWTYGKICFVPINRIKRCFYSSTQ